MGKIGVHISLWLLLSGCSTSGGEIDATNESTMSSVALVVVPDVRNLSRDQAADILVGLGLFPKFEPTESNLQPDSVVFQSPAGGKQIQVGDTVLIRYAIEAKNDVKVVLEVRDQLWNKLENNECEFRQENIRVGQSLRLVGPDGVDLAAASIVSNGIIVESVASDNPGTVCEWTFTFKDVPEVATYTLVDPASNIYPAVPLANAKRDGWTFYWWWGSN